MIKDSLNVILDIETIDKTIFIPIKCDLNPILV